MSESLSLADLIAACSPGGSAALTIVDELAPAGGGHATVAPARYIDGRKNPTFAFETRYIDGLSCNTVVIDSKQSVSNRDEQAVVRARDDESNPAHAVLKRVPTIVVNYGDETYSDLDLPHRAFDGHCRAGRIDGDPAATHVKYRALRDSTPSNASALFKTSPTTVLYGGWDSSRKANQARFRTAFSGEVIGVTADQEETGKLSPTRGAGRVDVVSPSVKLDGSGLEAILSPQEAELSDGNVEKLRNEVKKAKGKPVSLAALGLGNIPPSVDQGLGGVACSRIIRTRVLSFAALRQLRFGGTAKADAAHRAVLAAYGLVAAALSAGELVLRANCDLREVAEPRVELDQRRGRTKELAPIEVEDAVALLEAALDHLKEVAGIEWTGEVLEIVGEPTIKASAVSDESEEA